MDEDRGSKENLFKRGELRGHAGWVTSLKTLNPIGDGLNLISGSRDKSCMVWSVEKDSDDNYCGVVKRALRGHSHFIQDLVVSNDNRYAISASWDSTLRLWDIESGQTTRQFIGHTKDVLSVDFSPCNRKIVSGGRDKTIKIWNILSECKLSMEKDPTQTDAVTKAIPNMHSDWVSCVRFSPFSENNPKLIVSAGWDHTVKLWGESNLSLQSDLKRHTNFINTVTISPDAYICASGGKDGKVMIWALTGKFLNEFECGDSINALAFNPERYWLVVGTDKGIKVWDLRRKEVLCEHVAIDDTEKKVKNQPSCLSLAWANDNNILFAGFSDGLIRVYDVQEE